MTLMKLYLIDCVFVTVQGARFARKIQDTLLHVNRLWESAQKVPGSEPCEVSGGIHRIIVSRESILIQPLLLKFKKVLNIIAETGVSCYSFFIVKFN